MSTKRKKVNLNGLIKSKKTGAVMSLVLIAVVILSMTGLGLITLGMRSRLFSVRNVSEIAARSAADAAITKALYQMDQMLETGLIVPTAEGAVILSQANVPLANSDAVYSYTVTTTNSSGDFNVRAVGTVANVSKTITCTLSLQGPFEYAIFTEQSLVLKNSSTVDGYNYGSGASDLAIGTNSSQHDSIYLKHGVWINGDVFVGPDGDPEFVIRDHGATIAGQTYSSTQDHQLESVTAPESLQILPSQGTLDTTQTISNSAKYTAIDLGNSEVVTIDGPVTLYVTGDVILGNSAEIQVVDQATNPDAALTIYLGGDFTANNSSNLNNTAADAKKLTIYGLDTCRDIRLKNSADFYGAIYAPEADVVFDNSANAYGAVAAKTFEQKNSASFNYDASLKEVENDDELVHFVVKNWSEN